MRGKRFIIGYLTRIVFPLAVFAAARLTGNAQTAQDFFRDGVEAVQAQQLERAADEFRKALALDPDLTPARKNLATVLWFLHRNAEAETEFLAVQKVAPQDPVPYLYLGLAAYGRREFITAITMFEKAGDLALKNPDAQETVLQAYLGAADEYDRRKLPEKALSVYRAALRFDPDAESVYVALASFAAAHANAGYGLSVLDAGLKRKPQSVVLLLEAGILHGMQGDFENALHQFEQAVQAEQHHPDNAEPTVLLAFGITQLQVGRAADAAATFSLVAERWPNNARACYLLALALDRTGDPSKTDEVIRIARRAILLDSHDANSHALLGRVLLKTKNREEAIRELETSVKLDADQQTALYQLTVAYRKAGRIAESNAAAARLAQAKLHARTSESELVQMLKTVRPH